MDTNALITTKSKSRINFFKSKISSITDAYILRVWLSCQIDNPDRTEDFYFEFTLNSLKDAPFNLSKNKLNSVIDRYLSDSAYEKKMKSTISALEVSGV